MVPRRDAPAPERRFFLADASAGSPACLAPEELHHALRVTRLEVGDRLEGLDGRGASYPLRVTRVGRSALDLEPDGEPRRAPAPGAPGAALAAFEVLVSLPKPSRAEALVDRLTQLGVARIRPLVTRRTPPHGRETGRMKLERLRRVAREACKQSGRLWLPAIEAPVSLDEVLRGVLGGVHDGAPGGAPAPGESAPARAVLLDPRGAARLADLARKERAPRRVLVGPEGGFDPEELEAAHAAGVEAARVAPHVLRIETAAEAALAVLVAQAV